MQEMRRHLSIGIFEPSEAMTGGKAYRSAVRDALDKRYDVEVFNVSGENIRLPSARLRRMWAIAKIRGPKDVWIRDFYPVAGMGFGKLSGKNVALLQHMYTEGEELDILGRILTTLFYRNVRKCDRVVTVANFWRSHFASQSIQDIRVIRNGMDVKQFEFQPKEIAAFKQKYSLEEKTVVYIGNCRKNKGVVEAYEALKGTDYYLVTSGHPDVRLPCPNFNLPYREYLLLLKISSVVVTLSKFREGWCRTAHEAMLCKTPVIGSGAGGMAELLEEGRQRICRDASHLPELIKATISDRNRIGEEGYRFAETLTMERFENEWLDLMEEVLSDDSKAR